MTARDLVICEDRIRPEEDMILNRHAIPNRDAVLDGDMIAEHGTGLDVASFTDVARLPDARAFHHMGESPDPRPLAYVVRFIDPMGMNEDLGHYRPLLPVDRVQPLPRESVIPIVGPAMIGPRDQTRRQGATW